jgi:hypothetical protein
MCDRYAKVIDAMVKNEDLTLDEGAKVFSFYFRLHIFSSLYIDM